MIREAFFMCIVFYYSPVECEIREYIITPTFPEQSESPKLVTLPDTELLEVYFKRFTVGSEYVGWLRAGQAEFPWLVELRNSPNYNNEEWWASGNLISYSYVLTTCRAIYRLWFDSDYKTGNSFNIYFFTNYLWEDYRSYGVANDVLFEIKEGVIQGSGVRSNKKVIKHPQCDSFVQAWDIALIELNYGVAPTYVPVIGYMPMYSNNADFDKLLDKIDLSRHAYMGMICYVASIGRSYSNIKDHYAKDYKVKYRVYWTPLENCEKFFQYVCDEEFVDPGCRKGFNDEAKKQLMCFSIRSLQGAVCDHDRGAPLVCDGEVYGLVTRGPRIGLCNNRLPLYFEVMKFDSFPIFFGTYTHKASFFEDPEPPNPQEHAKDTNLGDWKKQQRNSEFIGLMFAGRTEYNWIADIRIQDKDQELWSIGNIISGQHILTTCKAIRNFETATNDKNNVQIHYCTLWLWEQFKHFDISKQVVFDINSKDNAGEVRHATQFIKYPSCSKSALDHDAGLIVVNKQIPTFSQFIGYMPAARDENGQILRHIDLSNMKVERRVCHVASYGRNYIDRKNHLVLDNKVKLRVYYENWDKCKDNFPMICPNDEACPEKPSRTVMCFTTRAIVGSICDHDRGAPLVCDRQVYGFVVRGSAYEYCNTVWHLPFLVLKISHLNEFHKYIEKSPVGSPRSLQLLARQNGTRTFAQCLKTISLTIAIINLAAAKFFDLNTF